MPAIAADHALPDLPLVLIASLLSACRKPHRWRCELARMAGRGATRGPTHPRNAPTRRWDFGHTKRRLFS